MLFFGHCGKLATCAHRQRTGTWVKQTKCVSYRVYVTLSIQKILRIVTSVANNYPQSFTTTTGSGATGYQTEVFLVIKNVSYSIALCGTARIYIILNKCVTTHEEAHARLAESLAWPTQGERRV